MNVLVVEAVLTKGELVIPVKQLLAKIDTGG